MIILLLLLLIPVDALAYNTNAKSSCLIDANSDRIINKENYNHTQSVASISKIMTAILAIESGKLEDTVIIGDEIDKAYGSGIYIKKSEEIKLIDLVYGLMLRSGNDAALAISNYISKDNFINMMNDKAKELNLTNTIFKNPSGLDQEDGGNISSACDMAKLMQYCMKNKTFRKITSTKKYNVKTNLNYYSWNNKNKLLKNYKYAIGGKTGFTEIAKRTLVTAAKKNNTTLIAVTLNDGSDFNDHEKLYKEAFKEFKSYKILKKGYIDIPDEEFYSNRYFYVKDDFYYLLRENETKKIKIKYELEEKYDYKDNDNIGKLYIYLDNKKIFTTDIYISIKKKKIKVIDRILDLFD